MENGNLLGDDLWEGALVTVIGYSRVKMHFCGICAKEPSSVFNVQPISFWVILRLSGSAKQPLYKICWFPKKIVLKYITWRGGLLFFPIGYYLIPLKIRSHAIKCWEFGFLGGHQETMVLEAHNVPCWWLPSLRKCRSASGCHKPNAVGPVRNEEGGGELFTDELRSSVQFTFPLVIACFPHNFGFRVSIFLK